jgi:hypothetical protein
MMDIRATTVLIAFEFLFWSATSRRIVLPLSFTPYGKAVQGPNGKLFDSKELSAIQEWMCRVWGRTLCPATHGHMSLVCSPLRIVPLRNVIDSLFICLYDDVL